MGNIINTPPLHSEDLARVTSHFVEERLLVNQTTHEDLEKTVLELVHLFADRFKKSLSDAEYEAVKAVGKRQVKGSTRLFHKREKNMLLLRAFWLDKWAEPSRFALRIWYPLKARWGWNVWANSTNPLKTIFRTDDSLCLLDEYDAWVLAADPFAQLLFGFLDNIKWGEIKRWDKSKRRVNCFGDDAIGYMMAAAAAKIIRDILLPEEKKQELLQEMRRYITEKLERHGLTIRDVVLEKKEHEGHWIEGLSEEECAIELDGVLKKPEIVAGYFSIIQTKTGQSHPPFTADWALAQQVCLRFGGIAFTSSAYHIINRTGILDQIEGDESFLAFVAALIGAGSTRVAHNDRTEEEGRYPERFARINPLGMFLLERRVARLRRDEMKRREA